MTEPKDKTKRFMTLMKDMEKGILVSELRKRNPYPNSFPNETDYDNWNICCDEFLEPDVVR